MRIALTHLYCWPEVRRGAERYLHELGAALHRAGHTVEVISSAPSPGTDEALGVPIRKVPRRGYLNARYGEAGDGAEFAVRAMRRLGARRLDVWHAMSPADAAAATLLSHTRLGVRSVYTEVGFPAKASRDRRPDRRLYNYVAAHVDRFVCLSQPAGDLLQTDYGRHGDVVGGGVDTRTFRPSGEDRHDTPVLLFPSTLAEPRKNLPLLLEATALLAQRNRGVELWLVGPGDLPDDLSPQARQGLESVTVRRTADSAELPALYQRAWLTVLPSRAEVFGLVALESMACGTPAVVLTDGLGPAGILTPDTGVMCEATPESLAEACEAGFELVADPATRDRCRDRASDFDWDTSIVPRLVELYEK